MENLLGKEIYANRVAQGLTQDQFGVKYRITGPAVFKFEKGYVKPSLELWMRLAKDFEIPETRAVLMWIRSRLPEEYQHLVQIKDEPFLLEEQAEYAPSRKKDYAKFTNREEMKKAVLKDVKIPKELKNFLKSDEVWLIYKPTGTEINLLRDRFGDLGPGNVDAWREALRVIRMFKSATK